MATFTFAGKFSFYLRTAALPLSNTFPLHFFSTLPSDARSMAKEVKEIILETIQTQGNKSKQEAEDYLKRMESQRRYSADVWS